MPLFQGIRRLTIPRAFGICAGLCSVAGGARGQVYEHVADIADGVPCVSPLGQGFLVERQGGTEVYWLDPTGPSLVSEEVIGRFAEWSNAGALLSWNSDLRPRVSEAELQQTQERSGTGRMSLTDGQGRVLTAQAASAGGATNWAPVWNGHFLDASGETITSDLLRPSADGRGRHYCMGLYYVADDSSVEVVEPTALTHDYAWDAVNGTILVYTDRGVRWFDLETEQSSEVSGPAGRVPVAEYRLVPGADMLLVIEEIPEDPEATEEEWVVREWLLWIADVDMNEIQRLPLGAPSGPSPVRPTDVEMGGGLLVYRVQGSTLEKPLRVFRRLELPE